VIGSAPVVEVPTTRGARARVVVPALCAGVTAAVAVAAWLILDGRLRAGGVAALAAAVLLVVAGLLVPREGAARARILVVLADRVFDGAILASVAWVERTAHPATSVGALMALAASFVAAYIRAKGAGLGYVVEESPLTRAIRTGMISVALIAGWTSWAFSLLAVWLLLVAAVRASQVAKEERL